MLEGVTSRVLPPDTAALERGDLVVRTPEGLFCPAGQFWIDPWHPVPLAVVTHAHADHAAPGHQRVVCAAPGAGVLGHRLAGAPLEPRAHGERFQLGGVTVSLHPAGHVLGSAQVRIEGPDAVWVVTGDLKRQPDPTCAPFEPVACDVLVTEATFALPVYRWRDPGAVAAEVCEWWAENAAEGRTSLLGCYALGKAQRLLALLAAQGSLPGRLKAHGAVLSLVSRYREAGVALPQVGPATSDDAPPGLDDARPEPGDLVLAPPWTLRTPWARRFPRAERALASGWMRLRGARRRRAVDRGFALSDHADWPGLLRTVEESGARRVLATHGYAAPLCRFLRETRGLAAEPIATEFQGEGDA